MSIPLLAPTIDFLYKLNILNDYQLSCPYYCGVGFSPPPRHPNASHFIFSPEGDHSFEAFRYWVGLSDIYVRPHITYFDSYDDIFEQFKKMNMTDIRAKMKMTNAENLTTAFGQLEGLSFKIPKRPMLSVSYEDAIQSVWGTKKLQAF